jgi:cytochrome c oxidase cbb3-type subunit 3
MSLRCLLLSAVCGASLCVQACERETRDYHARPVQNSPAVSPTSLRAGGGGVAPSANAAAAEYEGNAFHIGEGKRYYDWYNCYGCHAAGGGDIGPPLIDDKWIYGGDIAQIRASIVEGRPNGMPAFRDRIPDQQIWEIAAYIRAMGGNVPKDAAPSRGDEIKTGEPLTQVNPAPPKPAAPAP